MISYYISIDSVQDHNVDIIERILELPTLQEMVFPAKLANPPTNYIHLASSQDFKVSLISQVFYSDMGVGFGLQSENGIEVDFHINTEYSVRPNLITLQFTDEHIKEGLITYESLKQTIIELVTLFEADFALLTDKAMWKYEGGRRYWDGPNRVYYPMEVGWMNYYGPRLVALIGRKKMSNLRRFHQKVEVGEGYLLVLQEEQFIVDDEKCRIRAQKALQELGLKRYESK